MGVGDKGYMSEDTMDSVFSLCFTPDAQHLTVGYGDGGIEVGKKKEGLKRSIWIWLYKKKMVYTKYEIDENAGVFYVLLSHIFGDTIIKIIIESNFNKIKGTECSTKHTLRKV